MVQTQLVNVKKRWKSPCFMGKSQFFMGKSPFFMGSYHHFLWKVWFNGNHWLTMEVIIIFNDF